MTCEYSCGLEEAKVGNHQFIDLSCQLFVSEYGIISLCDRGHKIVVQNKLCAFFCSFCGHSKVHIRQHSSFIIAECETGPYQECDSLQIFSSFLNSFLKLFDISSPFMQVGINDLLLRL